jgi:quinol monooxygenase YgiN
MTDEAPADGQMGNALLPGRVGLFVRLAAKPGARTGLLDALHRYADRLSAEPHTEAFVIALDPEDQDVVWLYEWFTDEAGLEAHRLSEPFTELVTEIPDLLDTPPGLLRIDPLRLRLQTAMLDDSVV